MKRQAQRALERPAAEEPAKPEPGGESLDSRVKRLEYQMELYQSLTKTNHNMLITLTKALGDVALLAAGGANREPGKSEEV